MQVANTHNNCIRILFNPRIESFELFDFLIVKSDDSRYIAQIIEIYDDKFDASQNVAKIKLFYRITENNEVMPYDNFTPNKECEITKAKQNEIEAFINQDKETFILGTNAKSSSSLSIQYDFFNNNAIILADKVENANSITFNLAKKLSSQKNVVIIDSTGILELENAKIIKAAKNFKLPFNYTTIDWAFNRCLKDASLEFQAIGGEIINEIKKFARKQENGFIPFNLLTRVLIQQEKATPYPELKLLLTRLKKYQLDEIFAKTKNEKENLFKTIQKNSITIIDISEIDTYWQKAYLNYILTSIEQEIYVLARVVDEQFGTELINKIYNKKKNITFIPNASYNYKKLPTLMQHCKNYILMPSLYQRQDFLDANFALSNLISDGCIVFGENTDNFLYLVKDYQLEIQEKRKNYRKIALTLVNQEEKVEQNLGQRGDYFENKNQQEQEKISDSQRLIQELSAFEASQKEALEAQEEQNQESFEEIENPKIEENIEAQESKPLIQEEELVVETSQITTDSNDDFQNLAIEENEQETQEENIEESIDNNIEDIASQEAQDEIKETNIQSTQQQTQTKELELEELSEDEELITRDISAQQIEVQNTQEQENSLLVEDDLIIAQDDIPTIDIQEEAKEETKDEEVKISVLDADLIDPSIDENTSETIDENKQNDNELGDNELGDDELDFFQMAQDSEEFEEDNDDDNQNSAQTEQEDDIDLNEIADNSINNSFEEIINTKNQQNTQTIEVDEKTKLNADILEKSSPKENLPIFKDEEKTAQKGDKYNVSDVIIHKKYGRGTIVKIIPYEERQLLQVEFDEAGKKLLDPTVADIKLEQ